VVSTVAGAAWSVAYSDHLVGLLCRAEAASARIAGADPDRRAGVAAQARRRVAFLSARLDASPLTEDTAAAVDARLDAGEPPVADLPPRAGEGERGWARALRIEGLESQDVAAVEYTNLLAAFDAESQLADGIFAEPAGVLTALHGLLCAGLVEPAVIGRLRLTEQAIHDGAQGRVIYHAPPSERLPDLFASLTTWLGERSATLPAVVVAGIVHEKILEWQPFEAANGRLARAAARLVLRARGTDPHGVTVVEEHLHADALGYYGEVAATIRRRGDLGPWMERWAEAACAALESAAERVDPRPVPAAPSRAAAVADALPEGGTITLSEYGERVGVRREAALADLRVLERGGRLAPVPRSRGLRWRRVDR
jgi:hypothetical protein